MSEAAILIQLLPTPLTVVGVIVAFMFITVCAALTLAGVAVVISDRIAARRLKR